MQVKSLTYLRLLMIHGDAPTLWGIPEFAGQIPPTPSFKKENLWLETVPSVSHGWYIFLPPDGGSSYLGTVSRHRSQSLIATSQAYKGMDPGGPKVNAPQRGGISMNHKEPQVSQGLNLHAPLQIHGDPPLKWGIPETSKSV